MESKKFAEAFIEGVQSSVIGKVDFSATAYNLAVMLYDTREQVSKLQALIAEMDMHARDNTIEVRCRSCGDNYAPDCELSELAFSEHYCGKNQWCTP